MKNHQKIFSHGLKIFSDLFQFETFQRFYIDVHGIKFRKFSFPTQLPMLGKHYLENLFAYNILKKIIKSFLKMKSFPEMFFVNPCCFIVNPCIKLSIGFLIHIFPVMRCSKIGFFSPQFIYLYVPLSSSIRFYAVFMANYIKRCYLYYWIISS